MDMHRGYQSPIVVRLGSSLPSDPSVEFDPDADLEDIDLATESQVARPTHITAWFAVNSIDAFARTLFSNNYMQSKLDPWLDLQRNALNKPLPVQPRMLYLTASVILMRAAGCETTSHRN
jgi:hypothetical protein